MKTINNVQLIIKAIHRFGYTIENLDNPQDVRRISKKGWSEANSCIQHFRPNYIENETTNKEIDY